MKKFLYLLLVLPLMGFLSSCHDDKDLPEVSLQVDYEGATEEDGTLYVVQGETLDITAIRAIPAEGTKAATLGVVAYYWDGIPQGRTAISPFAISINTTDLPLGSHVLTVSASVLQVDKEVATALAQFKIEIVANDNNQPDDSGNGTGTLSPETRVTDQAN